MNDLKALLVDLDSFQVDSDLSWGGLDKTIDALFFSNSPSRLSNIKQSRPKSYTSSDDPFEQTWGNPSIICDHLDTRCLDSYQTIFVSANTDHLFDVHQFGMPTIRISPNPSFYPLNCLGQIPDLSLRSVDSLNAVVNAQSLGYVSEVESTHPNPKNLSEGAAHLRFIYTTKMIEGVNTIILIGGRYFGSRDVRSNYHQLSRRILRNKDIRTRQDRFFSKAFSNLILLAHQRIEPVDGVTRIPPRPTETDDRFSNIVRQLCHCHHLEDWSMALNCVKDYPKLKALDSNERHNATRDVFEADVHFKNKHVVLLDDVITTGATACSAAGALYLQGAKRVTIALLAVNQYTNGIQSLYHKPLTCRNGHDLFLRFNRYNENAFFSCSSYNSCPSSSLSFADGIRLHNERNGLLTSTGNTPNYLF